MERLLLVACPALAMAGVPGEDEGGQRFRQFSRVVDTLTGICPWIDVVRPGVCALPIKGPARYFGGDAAVLTHVADALTAIQHTGEYVTAATTTVADVPRLGVAEGVFAAKLASEVGAVVPPGGTPAFLAPWSVDVLVTPGLCELLPRLGLHTLGLFAALPASHVLARFGAAGAHCHRVARGLDGELPGYRTPGLVERLAALQHGIPLREQQPGFWGGTCEADARAADALVGLQRQFGPEAVTVPVVGGGRGPGDRARFVPWRSDVAVTNATIGSTAVTNAITPAPPAPWPGQIPPPAPARVPRTATRAEVVDTTGVPVRVNGRGMLTGRPDRASFAGGAWLAITGWSAPWPAEERWWSLTRRRSARMQITTGNGHAHLLLVERGQWWVVATYD